MTTAAVTRAPDAAPGRGRLVSLDALRGFDMFWIIGGQEVVKGLARAFPGKVSSAITEQLEHVEWEGLHFYDVIWPLFMFMVGVSLAFSLARRQSASKSKGTLYRHAIIRAAILFVLGMIAQGNLLEFDLSTFRPCYSVLHGIAAGYLIAFVVALNLTPKWQAAVTGAFLVLYWILLLAIPVPGFGRGVLTPEGNAAAYIDHLVLGSLSYGLNTWFLSYLGFASSVLIGVLAGELLLSARSPRAKCASLAACGTGLVILGLVWSVWFPMIKLLWTSSYVLIAGGLSCLAMALFYLLADVLGRKRMMFAFVVIGMNPLAVYMATMLFDFRKIGDVFVGHLLPRAGSWSGAVEATAAFAVVWLILYWMYRTSSFVKL
jgi:predicted acyltransferase